MHINKFIKIVISLSWIAICLLYYNVNYSKFNSYASSTNFPSEHVEIRQNYTQPNKEKYLINTPGCYIPNYGRTLNFKEEKFLLKTCGVRAVIVKKIAYDKIELKIDKTKMDTYSNGKTYQCCVRFASPFKVNDKINLTKLEYSTCTPFKNGSKMQLEQEIIIVTCLSKNVKIYEDAYIVLKKKIKYKDEEKPINSWNVLILGMDTMSRARLFASMPQTAKYLREHNWLDFRGYQKVGYNTFPNVMSLMTGKNVSAIYKACSKGLDKCRDLLLWNKFQEADYFTAYGEEYLRLPDTFSKFDGFSESPTDHYMRPFFLTGETRSGNYVCTKKLPSVNHLLDYAHQFAEAYKNRKFFGMFWINSCSHNLDNTPTIFDNDFVTFFEKMHDSGLMDKTFIIFVSDHGIRYGGMRVPVESYYEERLPMCQVWAPKKFREQFPEKYANMQVNQDRLITPYDLHLTMWDILKITQESNETITSEACPLCKSLFTEVSTERTCVDAGVHEKWCSCHNMTAIDKSKSDIIRSMKLTQEYLDKITNSTKTGPCTECERFKVKTILRSHSYKYPGDNIVYYVIAFVVVPGDIGYEVIVQKNGEEFSILERMETITPYNPKGSCVKNPNDRGYCVCKKLNNCKLKR